jgi:hypothetical protein
VRAAGAIVKAWAKAALTPICATAARAWWRPNEAVIPSVSRGIPMRYLQGNFAGSLDFARDDSGGVI